MCVSFAGSEPLSNAPAEPRDRCGDLAAGPAAGPASDTAGVEEGRALDNEGTVFKEDRTLWVQLGDLLDLNLPLYF